MNRYVSILIRTAILLLAAALASADALAQHSWRWLSYSSLAKHQWAVALSPDNRHAATVGVGGTLYVSADSGATWEFREVRIIGDFTSAAYSADSTLIVTAEDGAVYRSEDHFRTWTRVVLNARDSLTCVRRVRTDELLCTGSSGAVYRSTDAGISWSSVLALPTALYHLAAASDGRVIAVGDRGRLVLSRDGGLRWDTATAQAPDSVAVQRVCHVRDSIWVIAGDISYLARSTDDGRTWERKEPMPERAGSRYWVKSLAFSSTGAGVLLDYNFFPPPQGYISVTWDGGATWEPGYWGFFQQENQSDCLRKTDIVFWPDSNKAVVSGIHYFVLDLKLVRGDFPSYYSRRPRVFSSFDEYRPHSFFSKASEHTYFVCKDSAKVQILSEYDGETDRLIKRWRSSDSSSTWNSSTYEATEWKYLWAYKPADSTVVIVADSVWTFKSKSEYYGMILATTDAGQTWHRTATGRTMSWQRGQWKSKKSGALQAARKELLLTDDGGITWRAVALPDSYRDFALAFVSADSSSYMVFAQDTTRNRNDLLRLRGDDTWQLILTDVPAERFASRDGTFTVLFSKSARSHLITERDGSTASVVRVADSQGEDADNRANACFVGDVLVALRPTLNVHISRDSGRTFTDALRDPILQYLDTPWYPQFDFTSAFSIKNTLLFGKYDGLRLACTIDQITGVEEEATDIFTYPPYPNPFTSEVRIDVAWYQTVATQEVTLQVYDALGRQVGDLTQQMREAAHRRFSSVIFDAADLPAGIYYVVSRAHGQMSTRQVLLQK